MRDRHSAHESSRKRAYFTFQLLNQRLVSDESNGNWMPNGKGKPLKFNVLRVTRLHSIISLHKLWITWRKTNDEIALCRRFSAAQERLAARQGVGKIIFYRNEVKLLGGAQNFNNILSGAIRRGSNFSPYGARGARAAPTFRPPPGPTRPEMRNQPRPLALAAAAVSASLRFLLLNMQSIQVQKR